MLKADVLAIFLVGLATVTALKQKMPMGRQLPKDSERFAYGQLGALHQRVNLTAGQKSKLRPIFLEKADMMDAILTTEMPEEQRQAAIHKLNQETGAKVDMLLTPEQRELNLVRRVA